LSEIALSFDLKAKEKMMRNKLVLLLVTGGLFLFGQTVAYAEQGGGSWRDDLKLGLTLGVQSSKDYGHLYGMSILVMREETLGFYASYKDSGNQLGSPYYSAYDITDSNDVVIEKFQERSMFSVGMIKSIVPYFSLYFGGGIAERKGYAKLRYSNTSYPWVSGPSINQTYYVNDRANSDTKYYLDAGMIFTYDH